MTGATVWITGLSGAGKSTIALALANILQHYGCAVEVLDGDDVRALVSPELGFSRHERSMHVLRVSYIARLLAKHGVLTIVSVIAPYSDVRAKVRADHMENGLSYYEICLSTPVVECIRRDVKGLYAAYRNGSVFGLTGMDDPYEPPTAADLIIDTSMQNVDESVDAVLKLLMDKGSFTYEIG